NSNITTSFPSDDTVNNINSSQTLNSFYLVNHVQ
ncbi:unnamed protein product, partial [Rotaria sp. Silwood1]